MLTEDSCPIDQRVLRIEGKLSPKALELVGAGLPKAWPETAHVFFVSYSYADLPIGKNFEFAFSVDRPEEGEATTAIIRAVTQQWGKPFKTIPHGWKTICVVDFPQGPPEILAHLPVLHTWSQSSLVALSSKETARALLSKQQGD